MSQIKLMVSENRHLLTNTHDHFKFFHSMAKSCKKQSHYYTYILKVW